MARRNDGRRNPLLPGIAMLGLCSGYELTAPETNDTWRVLLVGVALIYAIGGLVILKRRGALRAGDWLMTLAFVLLPFAIAFVRG
jgi:hypothetical protein